MLHGCGSEESGRQLRVDLVTDFVPAAEFDAVRVSIGEGDIRENFDHIVDPSRDYVRGVALGDTRVPASEQSVEVSLFQDGALVIARRVSVIVQAPVTVATVVITRDCRGIMCPGSGDSPLLVSCLGGQCADPRCTVETPEFCPAGTCFGVDGCRAHACAVATCVTGACLYDPDDSRCAEGERCDVELDCVAADFDAGTPDVGTPDAGMRDVSMPDVSMPDAGPTPDVFDGGPPPDVFDAGPPPGCSGPDANTVFLFDFQTGNDLVGSIPGVLREGAVRVGDTSPCGGPVLSTPGPGVSRFLIADRAAFQLDRGSIDFWVRLPAVADGTTVGLVSRDAAGADEPGHLTLFFSLDERLVLRGQMGIASAVVLCSGTVPRDRWVRIGINFGPSGLEFFVNGVQQMEGGMYNLFGRPLACSSSTIPFSIAGTTNPFVLGASSQDSMNGSDEPPSLPGAGWRYDHFRVSRVSRDYAAEL